MKQMPVRRMRWVRYLYLMLATFSLSWTLSGCIVHHRGRSYRRGRPARCRTVCTRYGYRRNCARRCRVWRNGVCVAYRQNCRRARYCVNRATRCK